jgi:diguanylate cyclase (GGDEF)-like protein
LANTSRQLADTAHVDELQPFLKDLLSETEQTLAATEAFFNQLQKASEAIAVLKEDLKTQTTLAKVDELTKLGNRHHLNEEAPRLLSEAARNNRPLSAIVLDIDSFKTVNDTWGHNMGDKVLKLCADFVKSAVRSGDLAVRMGGDEFLLLCPTLDKTSAAKMAERVRKGIVDTDITIRGRSLSVTMSGGVAEYRPGEELSALIARADEALYKAKAAGRNTVCVEE